MRPEVAGLVCHAAGMVPTLSMDDEYPETLVADATMWFSTALMAWRELGC